MVPYLDYPNMKEFYTIAEVGRLFKMEKKDLKLYSERFEIFPVRDQFGNYGFPKKELRKLHNKIYREQRAQASDEALYNSNEEDPWARPQFSRSRKSPHFSKPAASRYVK